MTSRRRTFTSAALIVALAILPPALLGSNWLSIRTWQPFGIRAFVDIHDIGVYFASSDWIAGGLPLYSGSASEYPLMANILFAAVRVVSEAWQPLPDAASRFQATWVTFGWWMWLGVLLALWRWAPRRAIWLWLTPAALYFTLYRFDVYPMAATFAAFLVARNGRLRAAALFLGLAIGLKGYAIFAVPAFAVWVWHERGLREAAITTVLAMAPIVASTVLVLGLAGQDAALYSFRVQAIRGSNGESTWDVIAMLLGKGTAHTFLLRVPWLPFSLQILSALAAAALRPRTFDAFLRAFVVGVGGFVTFAVFYSPQFYLWFVPAIALADSLALLIPMLTLGWVSFVYFPLAIEGRALFRVVITAVTVVRTAVIGAAPLPFLPRRTSNGANPDSPDSPDASGAPCSASR